MAASAESAWVGDRDPTLDDSPNANDLPQAQWLTGYKKRLLATVDLSGLAQRIDHLPAGVTSARSRTYTYPLVSLFQISNPPPSHGELERLRSIFLTLFTGHHFLRQHPVLPPTTYPPSLALSYAALGSALDEAQYGGHASPTSYSLELFRTGMRVWVVTVETDNTEARSPMAILAVCGSRQFQSSVLTCLQAALLATCGLMSADASDHDLSDSLLYYAVPVSESHTNRRHREL
jgi:hypothetical protein